MIIAAKIFLGKYRVSAEEIGAIGPPDSDNRLAYQAEEIDSGKKVLVEILSVRSLEKEAREQLERSARVATKLNHVNIHPLHDFGVQDDRFVCVSEDPEGTVLEEWVKIHGPMPVGPVLRIASQVVSALGAAGFHQIVHRAITPRNLVLVPGQTAEGDWPLVKLLHFEGLTESLGRTGTSGASDRFLQYASPEQLRYGVVDFRSEVYSLGATMWFLLTGAPPPMGPEGLQSASRASEKAEGSGIPERIQRLLTKMLSVNPTARPRDPLAFYLQLQECLTEAGVREPIPQTIAVLAEKPSLRIPGLPTGPAISTKVIGIAVLLLSITLLGAILLPWYLRSHRAVPSAQMAKRNVAAANATVPPTPSRSGGPIVMVGAPKTTPSQPSPALPFSVNLISFTPMTGTPGAKDFKVPTLTFRIDATSPVTISEASFYIDSAPFSEKSALRPPITLFVHTGIFLGPPGTVVDPSHPMERTIWLKSQENLFSNWLVAYNESESGTFRWTITGQPSGSTVKPLHNGWSSARPTPAVRRAKPVERD